MATMELDAAVPDRILDIVAAAGLALRRACASRLRVADESYPLLVFRELPPTPARWHRRLSSSRVQIA